MALTEAQKLKMAQIIGVDYITVNDQIFNLGTAYITAEVETQLLAQIARWDAGAGTDFVSVEPNTANFGARIDPNLEKADIRKNIANLLYLTDFLPSGQIRLVRGG
jgi:hypothetical protein